MTQEECAKLVESLMDEKPWADKVWSRVALAIAARAIRRGRLLTEREKAENLIRAIYEPEDEDAEN
jgi:hypothetical protein